MTPDGEAGGRPRSAARLIGLAAVASAMVVVLLALGTWQVQRRSWKLDLIARVDARIHAPAVAAPGPEEWPRVTAADDEYRHVAVTGRFLDGQRTLVQAVTDYGPGFWLLTPFETTQGFTVLVDRGFVPPDWRDPVEREAGRAQRESTVTGLLRMTEPGAGFLRHNAPAEDRWYSRDVAAIAARRGLGTVAPYFIDADGPPRPGVYPIAGLTVVRFPNNHLVYALTWYGLAILLAGAMVPILREEWRKRRQSPPVA